MKKLNEKGKNAECRKPLVLSQKTMEFMSSVKKNASPAKNHDEAVGFFLLYSTVESFHLRR